MIYPFYLYMYEEAVNKGFPPTTNDLDENEPFLSVFSILSFSLSQQFYMDTRTKSITRAPLRATLECVLHTLIVRVVAVPVVST